jgi:type I restriction enzyme S subunit
MAMELDELPDGWELKPLSDPSVATLNPKKSEVSGLDARLEVTFVPMAAVDDGSGTIARPEVRRLGEVKKGYTYFKEGDVIFAKITPCMENGKSAIAGGLRNGIGFGSTEFHVVRAGPETQPEWLHLILRSQQVRDDAENAMHGAAGQQRVPIEFLEQLEIPVPPLAEQRRIVARVEALTCRLGQARLARQAALAEATTVGHAVWDRAFADIPPEKWQPIGAHAKVQGGYAFKGEWFVADGIRLLRNQNVYHGDLDWSDTVHLPLSRRGEFKQFELVEGDIVITMDRPLIKSGLKAARVSKKDLPCLLLQRVGRFLCDDELDKNYLLHFLFSQSFIPHISGDGRSCAVPHISPKQIGAIPIPLPSRREQRAIIARLDAMRGKLDELQQLQREVEVELASFTPALLAKAFRGEL